MRFGAQLWSQQTDWPGFRDTALAAEAAGWDSVWTWDHLLAILGPWEQPIFEGWMALAGVAPLTKRIRLGLMVGANTFRNPGLTAKLATTLDHVSGGRAVLGIGGAWFEREHDAFGIDFGAGVGERLDRLDEAVRVIRRLLDGERFSHEGRFYTLPRRALRAAPGPGPPADPRRRLRAAQDAPDDARSGRRLEYGGLVDEVREQGRRSWSEHCADVGRDPAEIERTISFPIVVRDTRRGGRDAPSPRCWPGTGLRMPATCRRLLGPPAELRPRSALSASSGFSTVIARLPAPYDRETIDRIGEVRAALGDG